MTGDDVERYARHLMLKEIGGAGQNALLRARLVIVGAGGLGGPAALYLGAAGIGHIVVIDDDDVDLSNLQRQIQFRDDEVGQSKAARLADRIRSNNPNISVGSRERRVTQDTAQTLLQGYDVILDGTDNFETRFLINQTALDLGIPLVSGAVGRFTGHVGVFGSPGPCYRCLIPERPDGEESCAEIGIIGALTGIVGSVMAMETIKLITGAGQPLSGRLWRYDGLSGETRLSNLPRDPACPACGSS